MIKFFLLLINITIKILNWLKHKLVHVRYIYYSFVKIRIYNTFKNKSRPIFTKKIIIVGHSSNVNFRAISEKRNELNVITVGNINSFLGFDADMIVYGESTFNMENKSEILDNLIEGKSKSHWIYIHPGLYKNLLKSGFRTYLTSNNIFTHLMVPNMFSEIPIKKVQLRWNRPMFQTLRHTEIMLNLAICSGVKEIHLEGCNTDFLGLYFDRKNLRYYHFYDSKKFSIDAKYLDITEQNFKDFISVQTLILLNLHRISEYAKSNGIKITTNQDSFLSFFEIGQV